MLRKDNLPMSIPQKKPMIYICTTALIFKLQSQDISDGVGWGGGGTAKKDNIKMLYVCVNEENLE